MSFLVFLKAVSCEELRVGVNRGQRLVQRWAGSGQQGPTFPFTHLQQLRLPQFQEEVLVLLVLLVIDYLDLNYFTAAGKSRRKVAEEEE